MEYKLLKIDKNGTKYWVNPKCPRCGGQGGRDEWVYTGYTCYECGGSGFARKPRIEKEYTPEYEAKLAERRAKRQAKWEAEHPEEMEAKRRAEEEAKAKAEAEQRAKEEAERAEAERKARSVYMGKEGEKLTVEAIYEGSPYFPRRDPFGNVERCYIHKFRVGDALLVWMTGSCKGIPEEEGTKVKLTGTVKEHREYKDEKQTMLLRCKIEAVA